MSISVIIPTLNEEENIDRIFNKARSVFENLSIDWEIIFVDDKSSDNTQKKIISLPKSKVRLIISPRRKGLGSAISLGWKNSKKKYVLFLDCDSNIPNNELIKLIELRNHKSVIIGSRYINGSKIIGAPLLKVLLSKYLNIFIGKLLYLRVRDISHSLRILPNKFIEIEEITSHPGYFWILSYKLKRKGYKIIEIPISFYERENGETKNSSLKMIKSVLKVFKILLKDL